MVRIPVTSPSVAPRPASGAFLRSPGGKIAGAFDAAAGAISATAGAAAQIGMRRKQKADRTEVNGGVADLTRIGIRPMPGLFCTGSARAVMEGMDELPPVGEEAFLVGNWGIDLAGEPAADELWEDLP